MIASVIVCEVELELLLITFEILILRLLSSEIGSLLRYQ